MEGSSQELDELKYLASNIHMPSATALTARDVSDGMWVLFGSSPASCGLV